MIYIAPISIVHIEKDHVIKRFRSPEECALEARWYHRFPQFCPELLAHDACDLVTQRYDVAWETPAWRDAQALVDLCQALFAQGVHHRDIHLRNILIKEGRPLLIDWFTAVEAPHARCSYDLFGEISCVPKPERHLDFQCWDTPNQFSIKEAWGVDLPATVD